MEGDSVVVLCAGYVGLRGCERPGREDIVSCKVLPDLRGVEDEGERRLRACGLHVRFGADALSNETQLHSQSAGK